MPKDTKAFDAAQKPDGRHRQNSGGCGTTLEGLVFLISLLLRKTGPRQLFRCFISASLSF